MSTGRLSTRSMSARFPSWIAAARALACGAAPERAVAGGRPRRAVQVTAGPLAPGSSINDAARSGGIPAAAEAGYPQFSGLPGRFAPGDTPVVLCERIAARARRRGPAGSHYDAGEHRHVAARRQPRPGSPPLSTSSTPGGPQLRRTIESSRCTRFPREVPQ